MAADRTVFTENPHVSSPPVPPARLHRTLRIVEETERDVYWINMHANLVMQPGRACFSSRLVDDIVDYQHQLGRRLTLKGALTPHVVLASDSDVFNLGVTWNCSAA